MTPVIDLQRVTFAFPGTAEPALRAIDWQVAAGTFALLTGPSGAGKSTLLRTLIGLVPHFSGGRFGGTARVAGLDVTTHGPRALSEHVGFVFQDPETQMLTDRVDDELAFSLEQRGVPRPLMRRRIEDVLDLLGIAHLRSRSPRTLSGGEQQRVAVAAAMATYPEVLALDEPTSQLDPAGADALVDVIHRMHRDLGLTVILAEHRLERLLEPAGMLVRLARDGALAEIGAPREVAHRLPPATLPPVTHLAAALGWKHLPLTVHEARLAPEFARLGRALPGNGPPLPARLGGAPAVAVQDVSVQRDDRPVLSGIDLSFTPGEFVAVMGRNGSGKTTLLRALAGFLPVAGGNIRFASGVTTAWLPQQPGSVFFHETVAAEVAWTLRQRRSPQPVDAVLAEFGLLEKAGTHPRDLSGGERERAALAAMLAGSPGLILLDEPTRGMDAAHKEGLMQSLTARQQSGATVIMATHDVELVARHATRVVLLGDGEVIADGHPREVLTGTLSYAPQVNRLLGGTWLTVEDVLAVFP